jgi:hypothetical protein
MADYPQTYNTKYIDGANTSTYLLDTSDNIVNVDSTGGAVTIILSNIANSGLLLFPRRIFINDIGNNAATNNITIKPNLDKINNGTSFVMNTNGESVDLIPCSSNEWLCNSSNVGATAPPAWNLLGNAGTNPLLNFVGTTDNEPLIFKVNNSLAGQINNANSNVSLGLNALNANPLDSSGGYSNVAIGELALAGNSAGFQNTAIGMYSLNSNNANDNTAVGNFSLKNNVYGTSNTAVGNNSLILNIYGAGNVAIGDSALYYNKGSYNTAVGLSAMLNSNNSNYNVAVGGNTLININNGSANTAVGMTSGAAIINGLNNTFLGSQADAAGDFSNCTAVGVNSYVKADNQMQLGNNLVTVTTNSIATAIEISSVGMYIFDYTKSANDTVITDLSQPVQLPLESLIPDGLEIKIISTGGNNIVTSQNNFNIVSYNNAPTVTYTIPQSIGKCVSVTLKYSVFYLTWYVISSNIGS